MVVSGTSVHDCSHCSGRRSGPLIPLLDEAIRVGSRRILLAPAIRAALLLKLAKTQASKDLIERLDSDSNKQMRACLAKSRHPRPTYAEEFNQEPEKDVTVECAEDGANEDGASEDDASDGR